MERVESAVSTAELSELEADIDRLETEYAEHSRIINAAIYPDTFNGALTRLKNAHSAAMDDASIIEQLNQRIDELTAEMDVFRDRMEEMNVEMSSLQNQLERAEANETRQAALLTAISPEHRSAKRVCF
jgi:chromosome segregation ATPase